MTRHAHLRYVDVHHDEHARGEPPNDFEVELADDEHVVNVETTRDAYGYASARVWITYDV